MRRMVCSVGVAVGLGATIGSAGSEPTGLPIADGQVRLGDPIRVENLTVFPIYGRQEPGGLADVVSLEKALSKGRAKVREQDAAGSVGTLVVENRGDQTILVLAGTVLKGGKQDRQVGQDLMIGPGQSVPVQAFCVERGRWSSQRDGAATGGEFRAAQALAPHKVRGAGQYEGNQGKVWENVTAVNAASAKRTSTDTLMSTYDDAKLAARSEGLVRRVEQALASLSLASRTVGLAYAVSGQIRGGRWFATRGLFEEHRRQLIATAAMEALIAEAQGASQGTAVSAEQVQDFVDSLRRASVGERKKTGGQNENRYRKAVAGFSSQAVVERGGREVEVTVDVLAAE
jgi:hypothetical protein